MTDVTEVELLTAPAPSAVVELAEWSVAAGVLTGDGTSIDAILSDGGTFFGRDALDAWRFLPPNGWRPVFEDGETRVYAAPEPGSVGEWAVATLRLVAGVWNAAAAERNVYPRRAGTAPSSDLELIWPSEQVIVRGRTPMLFAKVKNHGADPWLADIAEPLSVVAWLIELPSKRRLLSSRTALAPSPHGSIAKSILVPSGAAIVVPLRLATIAPESLLPGTYGIVGRLDQLGLSSELGTIAIVER